MINKLSPLVVLFFGGIILTIGDIFAATWVRSGGGIFLYFMVILFYILGMVILIFSYEKEDIPVASIILVMFNVTILTVVGIVLFKEEVSVAKIIGIILGLISITFLELGKKKIFIK